MSTRARATSMRAIRHGARKLTARARAVRALLSTGTKGRIPALWSDAGWFRDRNRTQPWVYPNDLEQQVQWVDDLTGQPRGWALGPDLKGNGAVAMVGSATPATYNTTTGVGSVNRVDSSNQSFVSISTTANRDYKVVIRVDSGNVLLRFVNTLGATLQSLAAASAAYSVQVTPGTALAIATNAGTATFQVFTVQEVILDQSWLGPELVTNGGFSNGSVGWTLDGGWGVSGGTANLTGSSYSRLVQSGLFVSGRTYEIVVDVPSYVSGTVTVWIGTSQVVGQITSAGPKRYVIAAAVSGQILFEANTGGSLTLDNITVREIPGNPSVSPSAGNGPTATARVNLLQRTEDPANAYWTKNGITVSGKTLTVSSSGGSRSLYRTVTAVSGVSYTATLSITAGSSNSFSFGLFGASGFLTNTCVIVSGPGIITGTTLRNISGLSATTPTIISMFVTANSAVLELYLYPKSDNNVIGDSVVFNYADLRLAVYDSLNLPAYQRVGDGSAGVFDYDWQGFPVRLVRGAANRGLMTLGTLDLTGTDAVNAGMWVVKTSDAATSVVLETSATTASNNGAVHMVAPDTTSGANYAFYSRGATRQSATTPGSFAAPHIAALYGSAKISTDSLSLTVNGGTPATSSSDQGTGNYGNHRLYEGGRSLDSGPSLSFTGEWLPGFVVDANGVPADLAAEVLREYAAAVNFYY